MRPTDSHGVSDVALLALIGCVASLGGVLFACVVYPVYFSSSQPFGLPALEDQQCAGALMWTCVTVVYLIAGVIVTARLLSSPGSQEYVIWQSETQPIALPKSDVQRMEAL